MTQINSRAMAARDPALAAALGVITGHDFGFGSISAYDPSMNIGWGWGEDDEDEYGWGAAAPHPMAHRPVARRPAPHRAAPHPAAHAAAAHTAWRHSPQNPASTHSRTRLLDPNRDSNVKVERYSFSFSPAANLTLGTGSSLGTFTQQPSASIKGQRLLMNAPQAGFVTISTLQIANVAVFVGGAEDAFTYNPLAQGVMLDLPRLDPQNRATASGTYTGLLPAGFTNGTSFQFIVTLQGPATLAAGYGQ